MKLSKIDPSFGHTLGRQESQLVEDLLEIVAAAKEVLMAYDAETPGDQYYINRSDAVAALRGLLKGVEL